MIDFGRVATGMLRTSQLDCLLGYVQELERSAHDEVCIYLKNKLCVSVDNMSGGRWQVGAWHVGDPDGMQVFGVGANVREALGEAAKWLRAIILAKGDIKDVKVP